MGPSSTYIDDELAAHIVDVVGNALAEYGTAAADAPLIPEAMTFLQWCEDLASKGLKIDGKPFRLDDRPALRPIYEAIPCTRADAYQRILVCMKATQLGLTVWEVLANIYMAVKWQPLSIGMFMPDQATASFKSEHRFMRIVRSAPEIYKMILARPREQKSGRPTEGNILTRTIMESILMFLWTSGGVTTESRPMDVVTLDEVQMMALEQIDKVMARTGDSDVQFTLMLSTANIPEFDIDFWYRIGTQEVWHTLCRACGAYSDLSDPVNIFPHQSIAYHTDTIAGAPRNEYLWSCPACQAWIRDPQDGMYIVQNPGANPKIRSFLIPRTISPRITPREMYEKHARARTGDQKKSFWNRTLARPYIDADQVPVTMAMCLAAAAEGVRIGLTWKLSGRGCYMGIDQMAGFHCVIIKERLKDGRQAVVHVEAIFVEPTPANPNASPWDRCDELMRLYQVEMCVVEQLPNADSARSFCNRWPRRAFMATYADLKDDFMAWGDQIAKADYKTAAEDRSLYMVTLNQYKCMQASLFRIKDLACLFPDPELLVQDVIDRGAHKRIPIVRDWLFLHLTKTALVVEHPEEAGPGAGKRRHVAARKVRTKVSKLGLDPHFSYTNMLCDVAWARTHGTSTFFMPEPEKPIPAGGAAAVTMGERLQQAPRALPVALESLPPGQVCGRCTAFDPSKPVACTARDLEVSAKDPGCMLFSSSDYAQDDPA